MKRFSEQLKKQAETVRMSAAEKRELRARVVSYMEYHPLPKERTQMSQAAAPAATEPFVLVNLWGKIAVWRAPVAVACAFVFIVVPVVAERSVPGDVLYPVKVQFNEEVRSTLAFSPYQKVEWETARLERRIAEARLLASEGKLTDEVEAEVAEAVKAHSEAAQEGIAEIAKADSEEAAIAEIAFSAALEVQSEVLESDLEEGSDGEEIAEVVLAARAGDAVVEEAPSYESLSAYLEVETTRATEFFNSITDVASEADQADVERRLEDIARKVVEAAALKAEATESTEAKAVALLTQALGDTRKLISFMTDIEVRETVSVESLVPVSLTEDERRVAVADVLAQVAEIEVRVRALDEGLGDTDMSEKVALGLELAAQAVVNASSSLASASSTLEVAEAESQEAFDVLRDLEKSLLLAGAEAVEIETEAASSTEAVASSSEEVLESEAEAEVESTAEEVVATSTGAVEIETETEAASSTPVETGAGE